MKASITKSLMTIIFILVLMVSPFSVFTQNIVTIGNGTLTNSDTTYPSPYANYYWSAREQYLIPAYEIFAAGGTSGMIQSLGFNVASPNGINLNNYTIRIGQTSASSLTGMFETNLTTVYNQTNFYAISGWNNHYFLTPYFWDGFSNLIVEVCFSNNSSSTNATVYQSATSYTSTLNYHDNNNALCAYPSGATYNQRPNMQFNIMNLSDAGILAITNPASTISAGWNNITAMYKNFGSSSINFLNVNWQIDNGTINSQTLTNYIPGGFQDSIVLGQEYFTVGSHTIKVWTSLMVGNQDINPYNDTVYSIITVNPTTTVAKIPFGSSANPVTVFADKSTCLTANQDLNVVNFTYRGNPNAGIGSSSGNIFSSMSSDGGSTWNRMQLTNDSKLNRYPSGVIFNPPGNTNPNNAFVIAAGPTTNGTSWVENFFVSKRFDTAFVNLKYLPSVNQELIRNALQIVNDKVYIIGSSLTNGICDTVYIYKGIIDTNTHSVNWSLMKMKPTFILNTSGQDFAQSSDFNMAWGNDGYTGYFWTTGRDASNDTRSYQPIVWKTTNGGSTWTKMPVFDFSGLPAITNHLYPLQGLYYSRPTWPTVPDGVVDADGNLHLIGKVRAAFSNNIDSLAHFYYWANYNNGNYNPVFDVYTNGTGGWNARLLGKVFTTDVTATNSPIATAWDSRVQSGKTTDGSTIFASWADTDPLISTDNLYPNIHVAAWNIYTGKQVPQKNVTYGTPSANDCFFHCMSDVILFNNGAFTIPLTEIDLGADGSSPVIHNYIKGIIINQSEFLQPDTTNMVSAPTATTEQAESNVQFTKLYATVSPNNASTYVVFQYGLSTTYTDSIIAYPNYINGNYPISVSAALNNLVPNSIYHYRVVARNTAGVVYGNDVTFSTIGCPSYNYTSEKTQNIAGTYTDLGTSGSVITTTNFDNASSQPINIGFSFKYNCENFTHFVLNTNGFIKLGSTPPSSDSLFFASAQSNYDGIFNSLSPADQNIIAAFNHDLMEGTSTPEYRISTTGTAPNRICTIQFKNLRDKTSNPAQQFENINFQIRLYETTNVIDIVYGTWTPTTNSSAYKFAACGLKGGNSNSIVNMVTVVKGSTQPWNLASFQNINYDPAGNTFNFGNPPTRPIPDVGRTFKFFPIVENDARVDQIYTLKKLPIPFGNPHIISANVKNVGTDTMTNITATLTISGANSFVSSVTIPYLEPSTSQIVNFQAFSPLNTGVDTVKVSLSSDGDNMNNTLSILQNVNTTTFGYVEGTSTHGYGGWGGNGASILSKFYVNGIKRVNSANIYLHKYSTNYGNSVRAVVLDSMGNLLGQSETIVLSDSNMGMWYNFVFPTPVTIVNSNFYIGLSVGYPVNGPYWALGIQIENPTRMNAFYTADEFGGNLNPAQSGWRFLIDAVMGDPPANDLAITKIYALTKVPIPAGLPNTISALVKNSGLNLQMNKTITIKVSGANSYTSTINLDTIYPGEIRKVTFNGYNPTNQGLDTILIYAPSDNYNPNNSQFVEQLVNTSTFSYQDNTTITQAWGENIPTLELVKYHITGTKAVTSVKCFIHGHTNNVGNTIYAVVVNSSGNVIARSDDFTMNTSNIGMMQEFILQNPVNITNSDFYVGFALYAPFNGYFWPIGMQAETPGKPETYYSVNSLNGGTLVPYTFNWKFAIEAVISDPIFTQEIIVGTSTQFNSTSNYPSPYGNYYWGNREQYLIKSTELIAAGASAGNIKGIGFNVAYTNGVPLSNFTIRMANTTDSVLGSNFKSNLTTVFNPTLYTEVSGWNQHNFQNQFYWDGISNLIIDVCLNNTNYTNNAQVYQTTTSFVSTINTHADAAGQCAVSSGMYYYSRPNIKFLMVQNYAIDAGIVSITSPSQPAAQGNNSIKVVLKNYGNNDLTSVKIKWNIDGGTADTMSWSGLLLQGMTDTIVLGNYSFSMGQHEIKAWTYNPNNSADSNVSNDMATKVLQFLNPMSGVYTIGADTSSDFHSFASAITAAENNGIIGPVIFKVKPGTYNEQINIPSINGTSYNNTITFTSFNGDSSSVLLTNNASYNTNWTVRFNACQYIQFNKLTVAATNYDYAKVFVLANGCQQIEISNCDIQSTSSYSSACAGIYCETSSEDMLRIKNNRILNGYYGIYLYGPTSLTSYEYNNLIQNNKIVGYMYMGIHAAYQQLMQISGNYLEGNPSSGTSYAIYAYNVGNGYNIFNNKINLATTGSQYGIYVNYGNYNSTIITGLIYNNFIYQSGTSGYAYGIYFNNVNNTNIYHNSINLINGGQSSYCLYIMGGGGNNVKNNIFSNQSGGFAYYVNSTYSVNNSDYNNYYTTGMHSIYWSGGNYDLTSFQNSTSREGHSYSIDPQFFSNSNLHLRNSTLNNKGNFTSEVTYDIDGETRSITGPDMGADEYFVDSFDLALQQQDWTGWDSVGINIAPFEMEEKVENMGVAAITSFDIYFKVNNATPVLTSVTGVLINPGEDYNVKFANSWNPPSVGYYTLKRWITNVNGVNADTNKTNDTIVNSIKIVPYSAKRTPLIEDFVSSTNYYDFAANKHLKNLLDSTSNPWTLIKYPMSWPGNGDPYSTTEGEDKKYMYNVQGIPFMVVNGGKSWDGHPLNFYDDYLMDAGMQPTFIDIFPEMYMYGDSLSLKVNIKPYMNMQDSSGKYTLHAAIVETKTTKNATTNGETEFYYLMKKLLTDPYGQQINSFTYGQNLVKDFNFKFKGNYRLPTGYSNKINNATEHSVEEFSDLIAVVWIQDMTNGNVIQSSYSSKMGDITVCQNGGTYFISDAIGSNYQWQVNAGSGFTNLSNNAVFQGVNTRKLTISTATIAMHNNKYRCLVSGTVADTSVVSIIKTYDEQWDTTLVCVGDSVFWKGVYYKQAGNYTYYQTGDCYNHVYHLHIITPAFANITADGPTTICQNTTVKLIAQNGPFTYLWKRNGVNLGVNTSFYNASLSGSYSVLVRDTSLSNSCFYESNQIVISTLPSPIAMVIPNGPTTFCKGGTVTLNASAGSGNTYQWKKNGVNLSGATSFYLQVDTSGYYQITTTNSNGCTDTSATIKVTVNALPQVNTTASGSTTFCLGDSVILTANTSANNTYQWLKNEYFIQGANSSNYAAKVNGFYKVLVKDTNNCSDTSTSVSINTVPIYTATFSHLSSICVGDTLLVNYTGNAPLNASYIWNFQGATIASGSGQGPYKLVYSNYGSKTISLKVSNNSCVSDSVVSNVSVNYSEAILTATGSTSICEGDSLLIFANSGTAFVYEWFKNDTLITNQISSFMYVKNDGIYKVKVTNMFGCSKLSNALNVNVKMLPNSLFTINQAACLEDSVLLTYTGNAPSNATYMWSYPGANVISGSNQGPISLKYLTTGQKTVSLKVILNGCSSSLNSQSISINSASAIATVVGSTTFCSGDSVSIFANTGPNLTYQWFDGSNEIQGATNSFLTAKNSGNYKVKVLNTLNTCKAISNAISVTSHSTDFNLAFTASQTSFTTPPFNVNFTNSTPSASNYSFNWSFGDAGVSTTVSPSHQYIWDGNYTVALYAQNILTGCSDTLIKQNYIQCVGGTPNPCTITATINQGGSSVICQGDSLLLTANITGAQGAVSYTWFRNGVFLSQNNGQQMYAKQNGQYIVVVNDTVCNFTSLPLIVGYYSTVAPVINSLDTIQPCSNDSIELFVSSYFTNYTWSTGQTTPSIFIKQSGNYYVTVTNSNGCTLVSNPYVVNASLLNPPSICIVGVDSFNHNRIIWEKPSSNLIDSFIVYRETTVSNVYQKIGTVGYNASGIFVDNSANPAVRAWRYRLTAVDTCGMETSMSGIHKTMHLTINVGLNGAWNLIWDGYTGFNFGSYNIYRGTAANNMNLLAQIPSNIGSYTDLNPPTGTTYYQIEIVNPYGCYPDSNFAKVNTNYNSSRSNTANTASLIPQYLAADFVANVTQGQWPIQVQFNDLSQGGPNMWKWSFGDGNSSVEENPKHTYNNSGLYTVRLISCFGTVCDTMTKVDYINVLPNGLVEIYDDTRMIVYPNPADNQINVDLISKTGGDYQLRLFDAYGQMLRDEKIKLQIGQSTHTFDIQHLSPGVYFVMVQNENSRIVRKVIVK